MKKRVFLMVLDSFGIGGADDAAAYGDEGSNTLAAIAKSAQWNVPNLTGLGLFQIDGVVPSSPPQKAGGAYGRLVELSAGKDTTVGHWELAGLVSQKPLPTYPKGLPREMLEAFERKIGRKTLCGLPYSGTQVLRDYGAEHMKTGFPIVYTSADSVFQIAGHEGILPVAELYEMCETAREMLQGEWGVGRVIARPFEGDAPETFRRTARRHDYSLPPPGETLLDVLAAAGQDVIGVGKIGDIFAGRGVTEVLKTSGNRDGMEKTSALVNRDFEGLCFVNLVDFDMIYGHRNDVHGYAKAMSEFDDWLGGFLPRLRPEDLLLITADHGCDPSTPSTDHSRENVPLLVAGTSIKPGSNFGTKPCFGCVANTVAAYLEVKSDLEGENLLPYIT
ncbi:phosphopentomutase [Ruminococcaceae bacterium OttesenSCG-928-I18]|nr:phosphopentomutase [Ruminococcaceae bacterium OttesenSCG-928-I18]